MQGWRLEHTYARLPALFHTRVRPTPVRDPRLVMLNRPLARALGLDADTLDGPDGAAIFAGNALPDDADPLAQAYAGHQFGVFTRLGDGRAILLGEQISPTGQRMDVQLKGAGQTVYSRRGDGRAALGPMLREYVISEAMHALGIPTTRSLAVATTGEPVYRETALEGAVLTRVAASHIRVGTMEWAAAHRDHEALAALADYTRRRHYPELAGAPEPHVALFEAIVDRQARLIAQWQLVGFVHGVMNTDNMSLAGETIDYGPCAFMDRYDPATVFSSIDVQGRYAYGNQPAIAQWNLARLAEAMLPLLAADPSEGVERANAALQRFESQFHRHWTSGMRRKLGICGEEPGDTELIDALLGWMQAHGADFTNTFRALGAPDFLERVGPGDDALAGWHRRWLARRQRQTEPTCASGELMRRSNPAFIPRNHKVEEALEAATRDHDFTPVRALLDVLAAPFDDSAEPRGFDDPGAFERPYRTFCGT